MTSHLQWEDGSGIFFIEMIVDLPYDIASDPDSDLHEDTVGSEVAWSLEPGFGDYADMSGAGEGSIEIDNDAFIFDGTLSID